MAKTRHDDEQDHRVESRSSVRPQPDVGRQCRESADHEHVAMRELDDVEHAEEQREAHRNQRIHHAEHQPVHDVLGEQPCIHVGWLSQARRGSAADGRACRFRGTLLLARQLALAVGVFAVIPLHELPVLNDVFGDDRNGVLAMIVEGDLADDRDRDP